MTFFKLIYDHSYSDKTNKDLNHFFFLWWGLKVFGVQVLAESTVNARFGLKRRVRAEVVQFGNVYVFFSFFRRIFTSSPNLVTFFRS